MKLFAITTITAGALAAATLGFAGAATATPAGPAPATVTGINLQANHSNHHPAATSAAVRPFVITFFPPANARV